MRNSDGGTQDVRAAYLVGCDGGGSSVRKELGIELAGEANLLELRQALYRCDELFERLPIGNGPGKRPPLSRSRRQGLVSHHAGFHEALDVAFRRRHGQ